MVLDVGTGTGVLAVWAAQAGARKVYAVEASKMAHHARQMALRNGVDTVVEALLCSTRPPCHPETSLCTQVIESKMEDVELPEQVDIIISEWMGYLLIYESMFASVLFARDRCVPLARSLGPDAFPPV